ncbi:MAG: hypothetical protein RL596_1610 [Bacteroidota bacterium]
MPTIAANKLDQQITSYLPQLNERQKKTVLTVVKSFMDKQKDWWNEINEEQQNAIDHSLTEMKAGKLIAHDSIMKKYH